MIQQQAFENTGRKMLKGGLHCHTTRSDGKLTPEALLKAYYEHGYNFVAITDQFEPQKTTEEDTSVFWTKYTPREILPPRMELYPRPVF